MQTFSCSRCGHDLFFENTSCVNCGARVGVLDAIHVVSAAPTQEGSDPFTVTDHAGGERRVQYCSNARYDACNWLVATQGEDVCIACRHNLTIPSLEDPQHVVDWRKMEWAKHRLFYTLARLGLPLTNRHDDPEEGLGFDFLSTDAPDTPRVMTGHNKGLITIDLAEADDGEREKRRLAMGEPYRTLIGHFRHEVGHWYWDRLVRDGGRLEDIRAIFGDDREDYGKALERHYENGAPDGWQESHVSSYATAHAWEDFAETWAHYLHIVDTLDTIGARGVGIGEGNGRAAVSVAFDPYDDIAFDDMVAVWNPMTVAINSVNRSMGLPDLYPFVLSPAIIDKLAAIHALVHGR